MAAAKQKRVRAAPGQTETSRVLILMEHMERQNQLTFEAVQALEGRLLAQLNPRLEKIEQRLTALEFAVAKNSEDIRKNSDDIAALRVQVERLNRTLRVDDDENAIAALDRRVSALERRLGLEAE